MEGKWTNQPRVMNEGKGGVSGKLQDGERGDDCHAENEGQREGKRKAENALADRSGCNLGKCTQLGRDRTEGPE